MSKLGLILLSALVLIAGTLTVVGVAGSSDILGASASAVNVISPRDPAVAQTEQQRRLPGAQIRNVTLAAAPATVNVGGREVNTWTFNGQVPGPEIRAEAGDVVRAEVVNNLPDPLTVHWHGIALRNDMDGVPNQTQSAIAPGARFVYEFAVAHSGSYFYHSHVGTQLDRGLYGPLIVSGKVGAAEKGTKPVRDITMMLDDWLDGVGTTPDEVLSRLRSQSSQNPNGSAQSDMGGMSGMDHGSGGMAGMDHGMGSDVSGMGGPADLNSPLGSDTVDVKYPMYLVNGRAKSQPAEFEVVAGERIRLRLVNASASTPFRVAYGGGSMTVLATDGYDVKPVRANSIVIGMGERYDVLLKVPQSGAAAVVAAVEGDAGRAMGVLRTPGSKLPSPNSAPAGLSQTPLSFAKLQPTTASALPPRNPDKTYRVSLTGDMTGGNWGIDAPESGGVVMPIRQGQRVRLQVSNNTMMWHPVHLHGHTFAVVTGEGAGPRKDTVALAPMASVTIEFDADNPGRWMLHCHNAYHAEMGMMTTLSYVK